MLQGPRSAGGPHGAWRRLMQRAHSSQHVLPEAVAVPQEGGGRPRRFRVRRLPRRSGCCLYLQAARHESFHSATAAAPLHALHTGVSSRIHPVDVTADRYTQIPAKRQVLDSTAGGLAVRVCRWAAQGTAGMDDAVTAALIDTAATRLLPLPVRVKARREARSECRPHRGHR